MNVEAVIAICFRFIDYSDYGSVDTAGFTDSAAAD